MSDMIDDSQVTKLYLCNGLACKKSPYYCFLVGGECCHTTNEKFSATKTFPDIIKETYWRNYTDSISFEFLPPKIYMKELIG